MIIGALHHRPALKRSKGRVKSCPFFAIALAAALVIACTPALLGQSHAIDASSFGVKGDGHTNDLPALQHAIDAAIKAGPGTTLTIPSGHFLLAPAEHQRNHLLVRSANGLTIQGRKDTVLDFTGPDSNGFAIQQSGEVTIASLTLERHPLLFTQGIIRGVSAKDQTVTVTIDPGYDTPDSPYIAPLNFLMVFVEPDAHTWYHDAPWPPQIQERKRLSDGSWLLQLSRAPDTVYAGKPFVIWRNVYKGWGFAIEHSHDVHIRDVAYYAGGGQAGFVINHSEGDISFQHFSVTVPPGSGQRFASAGGAMVFNNRIHLSIEDSDFDLTDDDNINMGMNSSHVLAQTAPRTVRIEAGGDRADYQPGDHIQIWDWISKSVRDQAIVQSVTHDAGVDVLTLDHDVHIARTGIGPLAEFRAAHPDGDIHPARRANEYDGIDRIANLDDVGTLTVRHSRFQSLRARNLLIKASRAVIEDNVFHDTNMTAILAGPEFYWDEGPSIQSLIIRNNVFENVSGSSIFVGSHTSQSEFQQTDAGGHSWPASHDNHDVRIEGNTFKFFGHYSQGVAGKQCVPVYLRNVDGAQISGNKFISPDARCPAGDRILVQDSVHIEVGKN